MEERSLLQQMDYLTRKIRMMQAQQSTNLRKPTVSTTNNRAKYWQGQTKIDNRLTRNVVIPGHSSKYTFKRTSTANVTNTFAQTPISSKSMLPAQQVVPPKISPIKKVLSEVPKMCYVNPHYRPVNLEKQMENISKQQPAKPINLLHAQIKETINLCSSSNPGNLRPSASSRSINVPVINNTPPVTANAVLQEPLNRPLPQACPVPKVKVHVNRLVYPSNDEAKAKVLVNPKVFARLKSEIKRESPPRLATPASRSKVKFVDSSGKKSFIAITRNKLVRIRKQSLQVTPPRTRSVSTSKPVSSLTKIAKSVCSKYKYIRNGPTPSKALPRSARKISPFVKTQYKLDRRVNRSQRRVKDVKKYSVKYGSPASQVPENNLQGIMMHKRLSSLSKSPFGNRVWAHKSFQPTKVIITDRKLFKIGSCSTPLAKKVRRSPQSSTLLRIGGVLYKSSRNSIARSRNDSSLLFTPKRDSRLNVTSENRKRLKTPGGHVVHVRGHKFLMDPTGKTLKRISDGSVQQKGHLRRVDLGGATYIQKTPNVLIRTNTHVVRNLLSQAKQRSIFTLSKRMQKNNTVCQYYRRFGKCFRHEKQKCPCVHDKKHVAICKSHLHDACSKPDCLLSHDLIPEKMPTCQHFLRLRCSRESCPYLHIKLNDKAPLCLAFLQGYCADGLDCRKWHFNICPAFDKTGRCPKGKCCPYPHKARCKTTLFTDHLAVDVDRIMRMYEERVNQTQAKREAEATMRYFDTRLEESVEVSVPHCTVEDEASDGEGADFESPCSVRATRKPIGYLPPYISLS